MRLTIKLKNNKYCDGCPCFWVRPKLAMEKENKHFTGCHFYCQFFNRVGFDKNRFLKKSKRPKKCIQENG